MYSFAYRLYPNRSQTLALEWQLELHRELYDSAIEERREAWRRSRVSVNYYLQANQLKAVRETRREFAEINYSACQQTLRRVNKAFQNFFRRIRLSQTPGCPRLKSRARFNSISFVFGNGAARSYGRLKIQGIGAIKVKWHRPIPPDTRIKQVILHRKVDRWYATFQIELPKLTGPQHQGEPVGIDLGLRNLLALSNGELIQTPRYHLQSERKLRVQQRRVSRRKQYSTGWRKAARLVARTHSHIASQRRDLAHKLSRRLADRFCLIAVEDLPIKGLSRTRLSKSVHDAGWAQLLLLLDYKVENTGSRVISVNRHLTSQLCSNSGIIVKKDLNVHPHVCPNCGLVLDRDVNAARNILKLALNSLGRSDGSITWADTPSVLPEAVLSSEQSRHW